MRSLRDSILSRHSFKLPLRYAVLVIAAAVGQPEGAWHMAKRYACVFSLFAACCRAGATLLR